MRSKPHPPQGKHSTLVRQDLPKTLRSPPGAKGKAQTYLWARLLFCIALHSWNVRQEGGRWAIRQKARKTPWSKIAKDLTKIVGFSS